MRKGLNLDFVFKVACLLAVGGAIVWSSLPAHSLSRGIRPVGSRGRMMPDFSLPALDGKGAWKLSEHRGEVVLVNFWATWCPPCRAEMPGLARVSRELGPHRFTIAAIAMDEEGAAIVKPFAAAHPIPYAVLLPPADFPMGNGIESLPTSFLVDKRGRIAKAYVGEISETVLKRDVSALLGETD